MSHPLDGCRVKIARAKEHISSLDDELQRFQRRSPYSLLQEDDPNTGDRIFRVHVSEPPSPRWEAIMGDAVHNLHSALDLLAYQLVSANGGKIAKTTAFPFADDAHKFESTLGSRVKVAAKQAMDLVRTLKPYYGGNDSLCWLHELDIVDKHRVLIPVGAVFHTVTIGEPGIEINLVAPMVFLEEGAILYRLSHDDWMINWLNVDMNTQFTFYLKSTRVLMCQRIGRLAALWSRLRLYALAVWEKRLGKVNDRYYLRTRGLRVVKIARQAKP